MSQQQIQTELCVLIPESAGRTETKSVNSLSVHVIFSIIFLFLNEMDGLPECIFKSRSKQS